MNQDFAAPIYQQKSDVVKYLLYCVNNESFIKITEEIPKPYNIKLIVLS